MLFGKYLFWTFIYIYNYHYSVKIFFGAKGGACDAPHHIVRFLTIFVPVGLAL